VPAASGAKPIEIDDETAAMLKPNRRAAGQRYHDKEIARRAQRLGKDIYYWRSAVRLAAAAGDQANYNRARRELKRALDLWQALRVECKAKGGRIEVKHEVDEEAARDLFGEPEQQGQPARAPARAVRLAISGVWDGETLRDLLHGLAQTVSAEGIDWRAEVEITPEEAARG
jgi:hypothetical protein